MRVGRLAAFALGGTTLVLLVASQKGYVHVNWRRVTEAVSETIREGAAGIPRETTLTRKVRLVTSDESALAIGLVGVSNLFQVAKFAGENMLLTMGFLGGFFLGMSFS